MSEQTAIFIGKTKVVKTKYGEIVKIAFGPKDFEKIEGLKNESGWVNLELMSKRDGEKYLKVQEAYTPKAPAVNGGSDDFPF
jgi:hypothetical protein